MANALCSTSRQWEILQRALEHLKIEYEYVGDLQDEIDLKIINELIQIIENR